MIDQEKLALEKGGEQNSSQPRGARWRRLRVRQPSVSRTTLPSWYSSFFGISVLGLICYFVFFNPNQKPTQNLWLSAAVLGLACFPMYRFLRTGSTYQIPVIEAHALFYALCFGLPGFLTLPDMMGSISVTDPDILRALWATLVGLLSMYAGYYGLGATWMRDIRPAQFGDDIDVTFFAPVSWAACGLGFGLSVLISHLPILNPLTQVASLIYNLGFYGLLVLVLEKHVGILNRFLVLGFVLPGALLLNSGFQNGQLAGVVTLFCWISLVILRTRKRVPVELLAGAFLFFLIFQPVKFYVRSMTWGEGVQLGPLQIIQTYAQGFEEVYGSGANLIQQKTDNFNNSFARIDHLSTTAAILRDTPSRAEFIYGASYLPLLTKWIPRAIWPGKPEERFGNDWAQRYGFLGQGDSTTSFNLPWLPEMFMNFGWPGIIGIMFLIGLVYRYLWQRLMSESRMPVSYTLGIVFSHALVITESNLSLQIGSIIIFAIALWVLAKGLEWIGLIPPSGGTREKWRRPARTIGNEL